MSNCLTQAQFVQKDSFMGLITASTDGHFTFWNLTPILSPFYTITASNLSLKQPIEPTTTTPINITCESRYQIHSNSIKSLELVHVSATTSLVIAGGDDNAVTLSLLNTSFTDVEASARVYTVTIPDAHAASVTTVKVISQRKSQSNAEGHTMVDLTVASSGNDHRVKVWSVKLDTAKEGVEAISARNVVNHYSPVADIAALDVIRGDANVDGSEGEVKLLVCGVGMEMVKFQ